MQIDDLLQDSRLLDLEADLSLDNGEGVDLSWESSSLAKKRRTHRKAPEAPKRFKSAYICYVMDKMDQMKQTSGPDVKVTELMKTLAVMWKNLPETERIKYETIAEADKTRYFQELSTYTGPMQVPNKRRKKDPFAPKRAMSAFLSYSKEMRSKIREEMPGLKNSEVSVVLAQRWRAASEAEKRPHLEREKRDRQQYYQDLAVWRAAEAERVKLEEEERRRQTSRETVEFLNLPEQLRWSAGSGSSRDRGGSRSGSGSGSKSGSATSGSGSGSNSGSRVGSSAEHSQDGSSEHSQEGKGEGSGGGNGDGDSWQQVTRKKKPHKNKNKKKKKKKSTQSPPAPGQAAGQGGGQSRNQSRDFQDSSRPQLQAWRRGPESQAMTRRSPVPPDATRPEGAKGLSVVIDRAAERASRDAIAAASTAPASTAGPSPSGSTGMAGAGCGGADSASGGTTGRSSKSGRSSFTSGSRSTSTSITAGSRSLGGSVDSQLPRQSGARGASERGLSSAQPGAPGDQGRGSGDGSCKGSDGATDSARGSHSPVSSDSGSKGGLSDTVHEGLSAFVSYMDGAGQEPPHRETSFADTRPGVFPSPRLPGTAHFTHSWRQRTGQGGGSGPDLAFWDPKMTQQWFSQPRLAEAVLYAGLSPMAMTPTTTNTTANTSATSVGTGRPAESEMLTLRTLRSADCAGLYDSLLPAAAGAKGSHTEPTSRGTDEWPVRKATMGGDCCEAGTGAGPSATFANALPPGWH